jgi:hypothetical protein
MYGKRKAGSHAGPGVYHLGAGVVVLAGVVCAKSLQAQGKRKENCTILKFKGWGLVAGSKT